MGKVTRLGAGRNGDGRASFVAHMQKIRELVEAGYTARTIHEQHGAAMRISYRQFMRYFNEYIGPKRIKGKKTPQSDGPEQTGTKVGELYFYNTLGGVLGSLATGLLLIGWLAGY